MGTERPVEPPEEGARQDTLPPSRPTPGRTGAGTPLGSRYLLDQRIGSGVTGQVWRGRRHDGTEVAVKILRPELSTDPELVHRFLRERSTLSALRHPHLVSVLDLVAEGDTLAIVMDLVPGDDLRRLLSRGRVDPVTGLALLSQVAAALAEIHAAGVVHRDIKPENVLVSDAGGTPHSRLTDFGLAWAAGGQALTRASQLVGTPAYVAPEVVSGRPVGPAADVYALGVTAYEVQAGHRPFAEPNTAALLRAHVEDPPTRPEGMAEDVWAVLEACLAKDPAARPTAGEVATRLAELAGRPCPPLPAAASRPWPPGLEAGPQSLSTVGATRRVAEPPSPPQGRRRRRVLIAAFAAVAVAGAAAGLWLGRPEPSPPEPEERGPQVHRYYPQVVATSSRPGTVRLAFSDLSQTPGFDQYAVFRDREYLDPASLGSPEPGTFTVSLVDRRTEHCWTVVALVESDRPPAPPMDKPSPDCLVADGDAG